MYMCIYTHIYVYLYKCMCWSSTEYMQNDHLHLTHAFASTHTKQTRTSKRESERKRKINREREALCVCVSMCVSMWVCASIFARNHLLTIPRKLHLIHPLYLSKAFSNSESNFRHPSPPFHQYHSLSCVRNPCIHSCISPLALALLWNRHRALSGSFANTHRALLPQSRACVWYARIAPSGEMSAWMTNDAHNAQALYIRKRARVYPQKSPVYIRKRDLCISAKEPDVQDAYTNDAHHMHALCIFKLHRDISHK